jgi:carboxyl-terminal processing protease
MSNSSSNRYLIFFPFIVGAAVAAGIFIGFFLNGGSHSASVEGFRSGGKKDKLENAIQYILNEYVDTLNQETLEEDAIVALLEQLDPHSAYIPAKDLQAVSEQLEGNFDGIGVEFNIQRDTIMVVAAISGGPSESLGIQSGDRIIAIEGKSIAGIGVKNEDVISKLRGKSGTKVNVTIFRPGIKKAVDYAITRGQIPLYSLDASYMASPEVGYIKISRFAATTYEEYLKAFSTLKSKGMQQLILDLRGNPGGYLNAAVDLCDEFLSKGQKIVYTEGKARKRENYDATSKGSFEQGGLVVLIDEGSASASEIVSGAVQDNDRGWVLGRRSFGKGLVQEEVRFKDGSAMRLTVARYYTPTGRCIQKSYENGVEAYYHELTDRISHGELVSSDSVQAKDTLAYKTPAGRTVYGGGGVSPDVFIPVDTAGYSAYLSAVVSKGLLNRFAFEYIDSRRSILKQSYPDVDRFAASFPIASVMSEFKTFAQKNGVPFRPKDYEISSAIISDQVLALMGRSLFGNNAYFSIINKRDAGIRKAIEVLKSNKLVSTSQSSKATVLLQH